MKTIYTLLALAALTASAITQAGPPPGHPSPTTAADMMQLPKNTPEAQLPYKGTVVSTIDANEYTYIEVATGKETAWLAAPRIALKKGSVIRYEDGATMSNFRSKLLNRTFPSVTFVNSVAISK